MPWEIVTVDTPAVIPEGNGKHRSEKRSWKFWRRPRHEQGTPVVDLLPKESQSYYQFKGTVSIPDDPGPPSNAHIVIKVPE